MIKVSLRGLFSHKLRLLLTIAAVAVSIRMPTSHGPQRTARVSAHTGRSCGEPQGSGGRGIGIGVG